VFMCVLTLSNVLIPIAIKYLSYNLFVLPAVLFWRNFTSFLGINLVWQKSVLVFFFSHHAWFICILSKNFL
jgi:hypothetical protein